jgi:hypothetical protein
MPSYFIAAPKGCLILCTINRQAAVAGAAQEAACPEGVVVHEQLMRNFADRWF